MTVATAPATRAPAVPPPPPERPRLRRLARLLRTASTPRWIARIVGLTGLVTLASALSPELAQRVRAVDQLLPATFPAAAATGAAASGILLVLLSRGLRRGKARAWWLATVLTGGTVLLNLVKGLDVEEALLSTVVLTLLLGARRRFTARTDPRRLGQVLMVCVTAPFVATGLGVLWLTVDAHAQVPGTSWTERVAQAFLGLAGVGGPVRFLDRAEGDASAVALVVLGLAMATTVLLVALKPADGPHPMGAEEDSAVRGLLERWGHVDSLGYFALRDDRSVIFSRSGKSAVSYRVLGGVSLAAGDPIGDPEAWPGAIAAWLEQATSYGWTPAVLGASERGGRAYQRAGLDALELGDEAVLDLATFTLDGRPMRTVRQAVARSARAGVQISCHRSADLEDHLRTELVRRAAEWRDGPVERGFSMALGRFFDTRDGASVVVVARDEHGTLRGLLNLVPWGSDGLSLDLMRRDPGTENGLVEHMVAALCAEAPRFAVRRISLNFAVLRSVFARGEQLGAGPVLRLWHSVLMGLSRFWQIESLYRANAKYQPQWRPRYLCFRQARDLPQVATAALRAESLLVAPWRTGVPVSLGRASGPITYAGAVPGPNHAEGSSRA